MALIFKCALTNINSMHALFRKKKKKTMHEIKTIRLLVFSKLLITTFGICYEFSISKARRGLVDIFELAY